MMPPRRRTSESGNGNTGTAPGEEAKTPGNDKRRSIPLPSLEAANRLKNYVGSAATSVPAWIASKAVPVAADGAGLFRHAAENAADRVALFRRGTQYDELEEEEDEQMKRRTMALSSADAPASRRQLPQPGAGEGSGHSAETASSAASSTAALAAGILADAGDASSAASNGGGSGGAPDLASPGSFGAGGSEEGSSVPGSARSLTRDEPAMISFDEDVAEPPAVSACSRHLAGYMEPLGRPTSASSSVSLAGSDLLADPQAAKLGAANWATAGGNVYRTPPPAASRAQRTPIERTISGSREIARMSPSAAASNATPGRLEPSLASITRMSPTPGRYEPSRPVSASHQPTPERAGHARNSPYHVSRGKSMDGAAAQKSLKSPQLSYVSDDSAMEIPLGSGRSAQSPAQVAQHMNGVDDGWQPLQRGRMASMQPLIEKGTPPPRPSRPPPPPPSELDLLAALVDSKGGHHTAATSRQLSDASSIAPEKAPVRRTSGSDSSERDSWDIFEPRMEQQAPPAQPTDTAANGAANGAVKVDLKALKLMTGRQLLKALEAGAPMRKKWVTHMLAADIAAASKTTRHVRCSVKDGKVHLRYQHQGVKGLLDREEVSATVQRVEVPGGDWSPGATFLVFTSRGVLALEPLGPSAYSQWVLGLNAALVACQTRRKEYVYSCRAHTIPRNSMFIVAEAGPAPVKKACSGNASQRAGPREEGLSRERLAAGPPPVKKA